MLWLENNASLFSVRKNKRSKDLIIPAQKYLTFVSRFFCGKSPDLSLRRNLSEITFSGIIARLIT